MKAAPVDAAGWALFYWLLWSRNKRDTALQLAIWYHAIAEEEKQQ